MSVSDLRGSLRLATDTVHGVTGIVESVHATIARPLGRSGRTRGLTGWIYRLVRRATRWTGRALDGGLAVADASVPRPRIAGARRDAAVAALNGVCGDALAAAGNPLATTMRFRYGGADLPTDAAALARAVPDACATLLVQVHGICMHDGQWRAADHDPGAVLADALGATRVALRYNSGRHIADSGRDFAEQLDALVRAWPRPVERLIVIGHSMGGLVARSAFAHAAAAGHGWPARRASLVMLGSPHHGAPLERLGNGVDALLAASRYSAPFARIGHVRSAGVTDLRYGRVHPDDAPVADRFARAGDDRRPLPLPEGVACFLVAATTGDGRGGARDQALGDGLVPLDSALGLHADPARGLHVPDGHRTVFPRTHHFDLLRRPEVTEWIRCRLLRADGSGPPPSGHVSVS
jgi:hypothetical protein